MDRLLSTKKLVSFISIMAIALALAPLSQPALAADDKIAAVSAGETHTLAVGSGGSLYAWGENFYGQLGSGIEQHLSVANSIPLKVMDDVALASAGSRCSFAVKADGSLWAWGRNEYGQLGDGTKTDQRLPVKIMDGVVSASAGGDHSVAVKKDGSLWAWGRNQYGQLGDGTKTDRYKPVKIMDGVVTATAGGAVGDHTMAIKTDGSLWGWGRNDSGQIGNGSKADRAAPAKVMEGVAFVSAGRSATMAIKTDGSLWGWGHWGHTNADTVPIRIMEDAAYASVGTGHFMVIKKDASLWAWGDNSHGALGIGNLGSAQWGGYLGSTDTPVMVMEGVADVSAARHTMAIKADGSLWAWGLGQIGQLGNGRENDCPSPVEIKAFGISVILDGKLVEYDVPPLLLFGSVLVPLRKTCESLGATVDWNQATQTVTATKGDTTVKLTIGDVSPTVNGKVVRINQPGIAIRGRTLVPLRFISEAFGASVNWNNDTFTVTIKS